MWLQDKTTADISPFQNPDFKLNQIQLLDEWKKESPHIIRTVKIRFIYPDFETYVTVM